MGRNSNAGCKYQKVLETCQFFILYHFTWPSRNLYGKCLSLYIQIGLSSLLPSSIIWGDSYMVMSSQMIALICWGLSLAELVARPDLFAILLSSPTSSGLFQGGSSEAFGYKESRLLAVCVLVAAVMCTGKWRRINLCISIHKQTIKRHTI